MKRNYVTPAIAVEYYNLTQSIAACQLKIGFLDSDCVKNDADATEQMKNMAWSEWFTSGECSIEVISNKDNEDGICYHTNTQAAFSS